MNNIFKSIPYEKLAEIKQSISNKSKLSSTKNQQTTNTKVIQLIHQTWRTCKIHSRFSKWSKSWRECFPTWNYILWSDKDNRNLVKQHYPSMLQFYDKFPEEIYRADFIRYLYLYHYGGLYVDLDSECLRPFEHLLVNYSLVFGAMEGQYGIYVDEGHIENSFMYSKPKHPFWMEVINEIIHWKKETDPGTWTGPLILSEAINKYQQKYKNQMKIYEPKYFNPFSWSDRALVPQECLVCNRMTNKQLKKCRSFYFNNGSFVLHYHTATWKCFKRGKHWNSSQKLH